MQKAAFILVLALVVCPRGVEAQARLTGADVDGTVFDQSGAVIRDAVVTVINRETRIVRTATTEGDGRYRVPALPPGSYDVSASRPGFIAQKRENVVLFLGQAVTLDFTLSIAGRTETVLVAVETPLVESRRMEISSAVSQFQIQNLPTNGRNFINFSILTPGVATDRTPQQGVTATSGLSFAGQRARSNNIMVDGLDNNDPVVGAVRATFSQEAVREFQVLANSFSAEFGKSSGGIVNIVTKSGTSEFRGTTFFHLRDRRLNAKSHFERFDVLGNTVSQGKAPFHQKQWGGILGGPLRRDRAFFFSSYERTDARDSRFVTIDPAAAELLNTLGFPVELGHVPLEIRNTEVLGKVDYHLTPNHSLVLRANYADVTREGIDDFGGIVARSRGTVQLRTDWSLSASETAVLSRRSLNEFRAQFAYEKQNIQALDPRCGGECRGADQGGPTLEITGVASVGRQRITPQLRVNKRVQLVDTLTSFRGNHTIKFGGEFNYLDIPGTGNLLPAHFGGRYIFSAIPPLGVASSVDGLQKGIPAAYVQGYGNYVYPDLWYADLSMFAQDEWQLGRLVLRPGIRYQRQFWPALATTISDVGGGTFSYPLSSDGNDVAPRVAAAYRLTSDGRTLLRASYGMFYDTIITGVTTVGRLLTGSDTGVRTLVLAAPLAGVAWSAPNHRLTEDHARALAGGSYASTVITSDPSLQTSYTHQVSVGIDRAIGPSLALNVNGVYVRGFNQPGTLDYNPALPDLLGAGRRPNDRPCSANPAAPCVGSGIPGTSASVLQYTSFGESWYRGLLVSLSKRFSRNYEFLASYTLSKAEDTSTDFQTNFIVQNSGFGRDPANRSGLPRGFDRDSERGAATHDQRHRFVLSGVYQFPFDVQASGIFTAASGRPFTPLAGTDLNRDGNGGSFPPDRARRDPADERTSVGRNSETTAAQYTVDVRFGRKMTIGRRGSIEAMFEVFNLFNRTNFIEDTNQSSFVLFGSGPFPTSPQPTYGRYTLTLPPRQGQIVVKVGF